MGAGGGYTCKTIVTGRGSFVRVGAVDPARRRVAAVGGLRVWQLVLSSAKKNGERSVLHPKAGKEFESRVPS